jgi:hypothetical protein
MSKTKLDIDEELAMAKYYDVNIKLIRECILKTASITKSDVKYISKCVMEHIQMKDAILDLPSLPEEMKVMLFGKLSPKEFIKICTLNIQHAENCKHAWYWKAYLADKEPEDYESVLKFLMKQGYEDSYNLFLEMLSEFIKKYKAEINIINSEEKYQFPNNILDHNDEDDYQIFELVENLRFDLLKTYVKHYDRYAHGLISDIDSSKFYKRYKEIYHILANIITFSDVYNIFQDFESHIIKYVKFDTIGMDDIMKLVEGNDKIRSYRPRVIKWIAKNSKSADVMIKAVNYFKANEKIPEYGADYAEPLIYSGIYEKIIAVADPPLLASIEKYVRKHKKTLAIGNLSNAYVLRLIKEKREGKKTKSQTL